MKKQLCPEGNHRRPSTKKSRFTENKKRKQFFSHLFVPSETCTPRYFKNLICTHAACHPFFTPICFITPRTPATTTALYKSLHFIHLSLYLFSFFCLRDCQNTGASEKSTLQLSTFERDTIDAFCRVSFTALVPKRIDWNRSKVLLFLHVVLGMYCSCLEGNRCDLSTKNKVGVLLVVLNVQ